MKREDGVRGPRRSTSETRDEMNGTSRERETGHETRERRERAPTRVRLARACPNIGDTHEAKRVRPEDSTERDQTPREGEERERE